MAIYRIAASAKMYYTFDGQTREGSTLYSVTTAYLDFEATDRGGVAICFPPNQDITIHSARLLSGIGVTAGDRNAAEITLAFGTQDDCQLDDELVEVPIHITEWDKQEKQVESVSGSLLKSDSPLFAFIKSGSLYNVMDFNVQEDWVGQQFTPTLELIIETDHLLTIDGVVLH